VPKLRMAWTSTFTTLGGNNRRYYGSCARSRPRRPCEQRRALRCLVRRGKSEPGAHDTDDGAGIFSSLRVRRTPCWCRSPRCVRRQRRAGRARPAPPVRVRATAQRARVEASARQALGATLAPKGLRALCAQQYANGRALVAVVGADGEVTDREVKVGVNEPGLGANSRRTRARRKGCDRNQSACGGREGGRPAARSRRAREGGRPSVTHGSRVRAPSRRPFPNPRTPGLARNLRRRRPFRQFG